MHTHTVHILYIYVYLNTKNTHRKLNVYASKCRYAAERCSMLAQTIVRHTLWYGGCLFGDICVYLASSPWLLCLFGFWGFLTSWLWGIVGFSASVTCWFFWLFAFRLLALLGFLLPLDSRFFSLFVVTVCVVVVALWLIDFVACFFSI